MSANLDSALSLTNLLRPELRANPYPFYAELRARDPVHWDEATDSWVLTRFADVASIYHDPKSSRAEGLKRGFQHALNDDRANAGHVYHAFSKMMAYADQPYHTRLRGLANKAFTPRAVEQMRPHVQQIVDELLDAVDPNGAMDVIHDFAAPLPIIVIAEMLGLPREDRERFKQWSDDMFAVLGVVRRSPALMKRASESLAEMSEYINAQSDLRCSIPRGDLLSALVAAEDDGNRLTRDELIANVGLILSAGHETTTNLIGNGTLALLQSSDQMQKLRANPSLVANAVEEVMRYDNPAQIAYRSAAEDVVLDSKRIGKGQVLNLMLGAANRDPAQFHDPDRFDIERAEVRHVGLGLGIHYCLGAPLARLEGQIAFNTLFRRFPNLGLASAKLEWHEHPTFHGLKALLVAF